VLECIAKTMGNYRVTYIGPTIARIVRVHLSGPHPPDDDRY